MTFVKATVAVACGWLFWVVYVFASQTMTSGMVMNGAALAFAMVFGWVLPPVLFVIPFLMLRELWKASTPEGVGGDPEGWKRQPENPTLWGWWAFFGVIPLVLAAIQINTLFGGGFGGDTESLAESIEDTGAWSLASGLVQLVAAIFWILFVRQLARRHTTLTSER